MKLIVSDGTEWELRDEQGRLVARCYALYSKTERDPERPDFLKQEKTGQQVAKEIATLVNRPMEEAPERKLRCCWCGVVIRPAREDETGNEHYICDNCRASVDDDTCPCCKGTGETETYGGMRGCPECTPEVDHR